MARALVGGLISVGGHGGQDQKGIPVRPPGHLSRWCQPSNRDRSY
jgi:hypothetical protein